LLFRPRRIAQRWNLSNTFFTVALPRQPPRRRRYILSYSHLGCRRCRSRFSRGLAALGFGCPQFGASQMQQEAVKSERRQLLL
jgi:hypothetical protein